MGTSKGFWVIWEQSLEQVQYKKEQTHLLSVVGGPLDGIS